MFQPKQLFKTPEQKSGLIVQQKQKKLSEQNYEAKKPRPRPTLCIYAEDLTVITLLPRLTLTILQTKACAPSSIFESPQSLLQQKNSRFSRVTVSIVLTNALGIVLTILQAQSILGSSVVAKKALFRQDFEKAFESLLFQVVTNINSFCNAMCLFSVIFDFDEL
jgi:hypothetical protein